MEGTWGFRSLLRLLKVFSAQMDWGPVFMGTLWEPGAEKSTWTPELWEPPGSTEAHWESSGVLGAPGLLELPGAIGEGRH